MLFIDSLFWFGKFISFSHIFIFLNHVYFLADFLCCISDRSFNPTRVHKTHAKPSNFLDGRNDFELVGARPPHFRNSHQRIDLLLRVFGCPFFIFGRKRRFYFNNWC